MNIFSILNLRNERYHNRMLAWLLNPTESHNLGSEFLAGFLGLVNITHSPERFHRLEAEYSIQASDSAETRRPDIYIQTDGYHIFIENKVRRASIDDIELRDQANYIRTGYPSAMHIFIVPLRKEVPRSTNVLITHNNIPGSNIFCGCFGHHRNYSPDCRNERIISRFKSVNSANPGYEGQP